MESKRNRPAACLAVLGTGSDVGKSILVTALCRCFRNKGLAVAPFKAQNMSNNSGVTPEGLEMGRAQIVQAEAAGIAPHVDMNPILLKPTSDVGSQVVLHGRAVANTTAADYHRRKATLFNAATASLGRLREANDLVIIEGAGSCAEVNLMAHDIVNFRIAAYAGAPVILAADIHRGGVFAQIVGTLACLPEANRKRVAGSIINRFRGDVSLFNDGITWIEQQTRKPVFGVLPWFNHIRIEAEDSVVIEKPPQIKPGKLTRPSIAVVRLPHIANFTDFDALANVAGLDLFYLEENQSLQGFSAVILPGSKSTCSDLDWLKQTGWMQTLRTYAADNGHILGICGGYQMLGRQVADPDGIEGSAGITEGLNLLPVATILKAPKTTTCTTFTWEGCTGSGYEIHMGQTRIDGPALFNLTTRNNEPVTDTDGCQNTTGNIIGTYIHGVFDSAPVLQRWLHQIGLGRLKAPKQSGLPAREEQYDLLAQHFERHIDMARIAALLD